ncbi:MAG: phosphopantetheine-binding protein [Ktedonobacteraceae bacterium]
MAERHVTPDASWVDDLDADSLDLVELIIAIEDEFDVQIRDEKAEKMVRTKDAEAWLAEEESSQFSKIKNR